VTSKPKPKVNVRPHLRSPKPNSTLAYPVTAVPVKQHQRLTPKRTKK
jgi:hypothetical protein